MNIQDLIASSRSFRSFDPSVRMTREELTACVNCARLSPSSCNLQVLKFRLVDSTEECDRMLPLTRWAGLLKNVQIPPKGHEPTSYIVICMDNRLAGPQINFQRDVGICAQSMMLCAREQGFGGCMIGSFSSDGVKKALGLPEAVTPQLVLALGKPDETVEVTSSDKGVAYYREDGIHKVPKRRIEELIL